VRSKDQPWTSLLKRGFLELKKEPAYYRENKLSLRRGVVKKNTAKTGFT
jgi:hypothetical protein